MVHNANAGGGNKGSIDMTSKPHINKNVPTFNMNNFFDLSATVAMTRVGLAHPTDNVDADNREIIERGVDCPLWLISSPHLSI